MNCWEWFDREEQSWNVNDKKKICSFIDPGELRIKTKK
jgi:hypothetical protein